MTTIVYDHKNRQIAVDSRATNGGVIVSDQDQKWFYIESELWFMCGAVCDKQLLINSFKDGDSTYDLKQIPDANAFLVRDGEVFMRGVTESGESWTQELSSSRCLGSGGNFALAAMDFGKSAKDAIEYAKTRDCYTGGKVHVFNLDSMTFECP